MGDFVFVLTTVVGYIVETVVVVRSVVLVTKWAMFVFANVVIRYGLEFLKCCSN